MSRAILTVTKSVIGSCLFSIALVLSAAGPARAALDFVASNPFLLFFGNQAVGTTSSAKPVTLSNPGNDILEVTSVSAEGNFTATSNCGVLAPHATCTATIAFDPSGLGLRLGVLLVSAIDESGRSRNDITGGLVVLTGCGVKPTAPPPPPPAVLAGTAVQGAMNGATITAYAVNAATAANGATLATTTADANGNFTLTINPPPTGPVRLTASGGSYVSEEDGSTISSPSSVSLLLASAPASVSGLSINPLTEFINSMTVFRISATVPVATALPAATAAIEADYGITTDPGTFQPDYTLADENAGSDADKLGLILGALINEDEYLCPGAPGGLVAALSADIGDGIYDGLHAGAPITYCRGMLPATAGITDFQDALSGLQQLQDAIEGFDFGPANDILNVNGLADLAVLGGTETYPTATPAAINVAIGQAAPVPVDAFASPDLIAMSGARAFQTATLMPNGNVLIEGGETILPPGTGVDIYNPANGCFVGDGLAGCGTTAPPAMLVAHYEGTAVLMPNGKVLIAGGQDATGTPTAHVDIYDPVNNCFVGDGLAGCGSTAPPLMSDSRYEPTSVLLPNGKVLIAGGQDADDNILTTSELYDPVANTFSSGGTMNAGRVLAVSTLLLNGKVLIAEGIQPFTNTTELYDPATNTFATTQPANMVQARHGARPVLLPNGEVLFAGGGNFVEALTSAELYDPINNCFAGQASTACSSETLPGAMSDGRVAPTATLLPDGNVLVAGGWDSDTEGPNDALANAEIYDPATATFTLSSSTMNTARKNDTATLLPDGQVLITGGLDNNGDPLASTELYTP
jgi:hypothetical protein